MKMTYAIVEICGKQLKVEPGRFYDLDRLALNPEENLTIDKVLLVHNEDNIEIGQPYLEGATVESTVMEHRRGKKILVYKMKPKKKTRKKRGHRQDLTRLMIDSISLNGTVLAAAESQPEAYETTEVIETVEAEVSAS
jgi:large subunit ribosomal protein L21